MFFWTLAYAGSFFNPNLQVRAEDTDLCLIWQEAVLLRESSRSWLMALRRVKEVQGSWNLFSQSTRKSVKLALCQSQVTQTELGSDGLGTVTLYPRPALWRWTSHSTAFFRDFCSGGGLSASKHLLVQVCIHAFVFWGKWSHLYYIKHVFMFICLFLDW